MYIDLFGDVGVQCQERSTMKSAIANALQPLKSIDATTDMGHNALHIFFYPILFTFRTMFFESHDCFAS